MNEPLDLLCESLARARLRGATVPEPGFTLTLAAAYAVADCVATRLASPLVGWKVGSTSAAAQARLGTDEPGAGALFERFAFRSGAEIPVFTSHDVHVEVEFAFRLRSSLAPRRAPYTPAEMRAAIAAFVPAVEIVGSRFRSGLANSGRSLITADGGANVAFVTGPERPFSREQDVAGHPCTLELNGRRVAAGVGARSLGDPVNALTWLANHLSGHGVALAADAIVTTGTCTGLVSVGPGDRLRADFGSLGRVEATLTRAAGDDDGRGA